MSADRQPTVRWVHVSDYYDLPLSGWIRVGGQYLYFNLECGFEADPRRYGLYVVPADRRLPHLRRVRKFRQLVGWHWDWRPGTRCRGSFSKSTHPNWQAFYALPEPPKIDLSVCRKVGVSRDLETVALLDAETVECPTCKGRGGWDSSGDGWSEYDECRDCGVTGRVTPQRGTEIKASNRALAAWCEEQMR